MNSSDYGEIQSSLEKYINNTINEIRSIISSSDRRIIDRDLLFIKMILTIKSLVNNNELENYLINELFNTFYRDSRVKISSVERDVGIVYSSNMKILRKIRNKKTTTISQLFSTRSDLSDILDYIWLRREGYLRKTSSGLYIDPDVYEIGQLHGERRISYRDIVKYLNEIPSKLWRNLINTDFLQKLSNEDLTKLLTRLYGYNTSVDQDIVHEIERRFEKGWIPDWNTWRRIEKKINTSLLTNKYIGPYSLKWIKPDSLTRSLYNRILGDLRNIPLREKWRIVSSISSTGKYRELFEKLDPITLSVIKNLSKHSVFIRNKALLGQSIVNYINYLISGDVSYLEYSRYLLSKINPNQLDSSLKPIYRSLLAGDFRNTIRFLGRRYGIDTIELIANSVWNIFSTQGFSSEVLWRAVKTSYEILKHSVKGFEYRGEYKYSNIHGRLVIRKTVFNIVRSNYNLVREYRERETRLISIVDISGSMMKYSLWAILALSSIIRFVKTIFLFSDKVVFSKPPRGFTKSILIKYLENLFSEGFKGYTNISMVFRELAKCSGRRDIVVLFSDLEQTVQDTDPVVEIRNFIDKNGSRLIVFVPPIHKYEVRSELEKIGIEIVVVKDPSTIPRLLKRKLNLKI